MYFDAHDMATWRCMLFIRCVVFEKFLCLLFEIYWRCDVYFLNIYNIRVFYRFNRSRTLHHIPTAKSKSMDGLIYVFISFTLIHLPSPPRPSLIHFPSPSWPSLVVSPLRPPLIILCSLSSSPNGRTDSSYTLRSLILHKFIGWFCIQFLIQDFPKSITHHSSIHIICRSLSPAFHSESPTNLSTSHKSLVCSSFVYIFLHFKSIFRVLNTCCFI